MKYLVTGATGFLGSRLVQALVEEGEAVAILKRRSSDLHRLGEVAGRVEMYDADVPFERLFREAGRIDAVIHCATCYGRKGESILEVFEGNLALPMRLVKAAIDHGVEAFVNADTILPRNLNPYALAKAQFREWIGVHAHRREIRVTNLRLDHFYGPGDDPGKFTSFVIESCAAGKEELNLTKGEQERDFIFIDDVISAFQHILRHRMGASDCFREYEIGSGQPVSVRKFVETAHRLACSHTQLNFGAVAYRAGEVMKSEINIKPLLDLGWSPEVSLTQGIERILASLRHQ